MSAGFLRDKLSLIRTAISRVFSTSCSDWGIYLILKPTRRWFSAPTAGCCYGNSDSLEQKIKSAGRRSSSGELSPASKSIFLLFLLLLYLKKYNGIAAGRPRPHLDLFCL